MISAEHMHIRRVTD